MGTMWYGGKIYTMRLQEETVEAVFTENGKIIDVGEESFLKDKYKERIDTYKNLNKGVMYPGFVDSHLHIIGHGEKLLNLDLSKITSSKDLIISLQERARNLEDGEWLIGEGWNENQWENPRILHRDELDAIFPDNPVLLNRVCRHAAIVNSKALEIAEIEDSTKDPQGGKIVKDRKGKPTGYLLDQAQELVKKKVPYMTQKKLESIINTAIKDLLRLGLVGGHSEDLFYYGGFAKTLHAYQAVVPVNFKFRAHLLVHHAVMEEVKEAGLTYGDGGAFTQLGAMKIFSDGALGGRTAWLKEPYADDPSNYGLPIHHKDQLEGLIKKARKNNMPVAVHAIGDQAIEMIADLLLKYPLSNNRRDRIIHAQIMNKTLLRKLKQLNAVLDIQPSFVASDFPWVIERLGKSRVKQSYPWKTYLDEGIPIAAGSDAPIEEVNPLLGIEAAVLRKSNLDSEIYNEEQQLSVYEAIHLYTTGSAYVINHEHDRGQISPGFVADFTILDQDLFEVEKNKIHEASVLMTVVDEEIMYQK